MAVRGEAAQEFIDVFNLTRRISAGDKTQPLVTILRDGLGLFLFLNKLTNPESFITQNIWEARNHVLQ